MTAYKGLYSLLSRWTAPFAFDSVASLHVYYSRPHAWLSHSFKCLPWTHALFFSKTIFTIWVFYFCHFTAQCCSDDSLQCLSESVHFRGIYFAPDIFSQLWLDLSWLSWSSGSFEGPDILTHDFSSVHDYVWNLFKKNRINQNCTSHQGCSWTNWPMLLNMERRRQRIEVMEFGTEPAFKVLHSVSLAHPTHNGLDHTVLIHVKHCLIILS